jgi:ribose transport system substrate-binding protein
VTDPLEVAMSRWNSVASLLLLTGLLISNCACGRHDSKEKYFLVAANIQLPYWQKASAGFQDAAAELGVQAKFVGPQNYDAKAEQQAFEQALQEKPAGILLHVVEPGLLTYDINKAIAAGVPVITMDADAPASKRLFFIGTNNYQAGLLGGERLAQELKGKGKVMFFTMPEQTNLADRLRGYREVLAKSPDIRVVRVVDIEGNPRVAFDTVTDILGKDRSQVDAFVCLEAQAGREVATVLDSRHVQDKVVIAMDTDADTLDWIQKGVIAATIAQKPYTMARVGLHMLDDVHHNQAVRLDGDWSKDSFAPVPAFVDTGTALIDKTNLESFRQERARK